MKRRCNVWRAGREHVARNRKNRSSSDVKLFNFPPILSPPSPIIKKFSLIVKLKFIPSPSLLKLLQYHCRCHIKEEVSYPTWNERKKKVEKRNSATNKKLFDNNQRQWSRSVEEQQVITRNSHLSLRCPPHLVIQDLSDQGLERS